MTLNLDGARLSELSQMRGTEMTNDRKTLGELFVAMHMTTNPVTRWSYRQAIANRLDRIERKECEP